jgi:hypothetical protein
MKTLALRASVFIHCFLVFGYPCETLALVVHILRQATQIFSDFSVFLRLFTRKSIALGA